MTIVVVLLVSLLSAVSAGLSTYYLNFSREIAAIGTKKAEELYLELEEFDRSVAFFFDNCYSLLDGSLAPMKAHKEKLFVAGEHLAKMRMLIGFYFPRLAKPLARMIAATATAHRKFSEVQKAPVEDRLALLRGADAAVCEVKDAIDALKTAILSAENRQASLPRVGFARGRKPTPRVLGVAA
jgi:hypothetical protein